MVCAISSAVSSTHSITMSVRWIITSPAVMLSNSKMFSIISFSPAWMAPFSSPMSTIMRMPSSDTSSSSSLGSICTRRSTAFVETVSSQMSGRMTAARKATTPQVKRATCSLFFMATRLGTNSPKTSVKKERIMVIRITDRVCTAASAAAVRAYWAANHWDRRPARLSAAKAEPRKPARVMPIWMVERNPVGCSTMCRRRAAFLSPSSAWWRITASLREMTAISVAAKYALIAMSMTWSRS